MCVSVCMLEGLVEMINHAYKYRRCVCVLVCMKSISDG